MNSWFWTAVHRSSNDGSLVAAQELYADGAGSSLGLWRSRWRSGRGRGAVPGGQRLGKRKDRLPIREKQRVAGRVRQEFHTRVGLAGIGLERHRQRGVHLRSA